MVRLEWLKSFELHVPEIDADHRTILELMKLVERSVDVRDRAQSERYLDRLISFASRHFEREESLLKEWGYPGEEDHAQYHADLLKNAEVTKDTCAQFEDPEAILGCYKELMAFLIDDVLRGDVNLKSFLENAGVALPD